MPDRTGQHIGQYRLQHLLGEGNFAQVYLGENILLQTKVAIKVFSERDVSDDQHNKIRAEAYILARLDHPNIVRILDFGTEFNTAHYNTFSPYLVTTYVPNGTLRKRYPKGTLVPLDKVIIYASQIADALQFAHDRGTVHCYIKPENMLIEDEDKILLSDFGIAFLGENTIMLEAPAEGVTYAAPESFQGQSGPASDQYSLAAVVYEWLCGSPPLPGESNHMDQQIHTPPPPGMGRPGFYSEGVWQVVKKALSKEPEQRYPSVKEFAHALKYEGIPMMTESKGNAEEKSFPVAAVPTSFPNRINQYATQGQENLSQELYGKLQTLPIEEQKEILIKVMGSLNVKDKSEIIQDLGIRPLTQEATDFIWKAVVSGAVVVFVGSAIGIVIAAFIGGNVAPLITVFTAVVAFLGGLLAPSPVQNAIRSLSSGFKGSSKTEGK